MGGDLVPRVRRSRLSLADRQILNEIVGKARGQLCQAASVKKIHRDAVALSDTIGHVSFQWLFAALDASVACPVDRNRIRKMCGQNVKIFSQRGKATPNLDRVKRRVGWQAHGVVLGFDMAVNN